MSRPRSSARSCSPDGSSMDLGTPSRNQVFTERRGLRRHPGAQGRDHERHRHGGRLRLPGRRQDRNREQPRERLVRRLHAADVDRGLGRLPAGQHPDGQRLRRHARGADLARLHAAGLQRLLRRLPAADHLRGAEPRSSACTRRTGKASTTAGSGSRTRDRDVIEPLQQPCAVRKPVARDQRGHFPERWRQNRRGRAGYTSTRAPPPEPATATAAVAAAPRSTNLKPTWPRKRKVELEGEVVEALPNAMFRVKLDNMDRVVLGHVAGKMRRFRIRILPGDRVRVELSPTTSTARGSSTGTDSPTRCRAVVAAERAERSPANR